MRIVPIIITLLLATVAPAQTAPATSRPLTATFIGNEAWHITDGEYTLLTDFPYQSGYSRYMTWDWSGVPRIADPAKLLVVTTHQHRDHFAAELFPRLSPASVIGSASVRAAAPGKGIEPTGDARFGPISVQAISTPHADLEHYSYVIEWHGLRFYLPGDTESASSLIAAKNLDVAFVTPWMLRAAARAGAKIDARRVIVVHHEAGESVAPYQASTVPRQGEVMVLRSEPVAPPAPAPGPSLADQLQAALARWAEVSGHHGVSASVILRDGTQWNGVAGLSRPGEPLRPEHLIAIASITKTMTAAVILQLVDESRVALDDPVGKWLGPRPHVAPDITVRQLMNHTSGLDNYTTNTAFNAAISADQGRIFKADELPAFIGPPRFIPGARTEYTNTAFILLGLVAEKVTGKSMLTLYRERLFDPLQMREVFLPGFQAPPAPIAHALTRAAGIVSPLDRMSLASAGSYAFGLLASARNVARWGHALFTGGVISPRSQAEMRTLVSAAGNIPGETGVGLGIRGYAYLGRSQFGHSGGSWSGNSLLLHDPAAGITVVVLMNQARGADHFSLAPSLLEIAARP